MLKRRLHPLALITLIAALLLQGSIALAGNWMPLPQISGPDVGAASTAWRPTVDVTCDSFTLNLTAPTSNQNFIELTDPTTGNPIGLVIRLDWVRWYVEGLYDDAGNKLTTETGIFVDFVAGQDEGQTFTETFNINTPLTAGQRVYANVYFQSQGMEYGNEDDANNQVNGQPYNNSNINDTDTIGDRDYEDFFARAFDPVVSPSTTSYYCGDESVPPSQPTVTANTATTQITEGDTGNDQDFTVNVSLSQAATLPVRAYVSVELEMVPITFPSFRPVNHDNRDNPPVEGVDLLAFDANGVPVPATKNIRVPYKHDVGSCATYQGGNGGAYCDLDIAPNPPFIVPVDFAPGETAKAFTVRVPGDERAENELFIDITVVGASHATPNTAVDRVNLYDDDRPILTAGTVEVDFCEATSQTAQLPVTIENPYQEDIELFWQTGDADTGFEPAAPYGGGGFYYYTLVPLPGEDSGCCIGNVPLRGYTKNVPANATQTTVPIQVELGNLSIFGGNSAEGNLSVTVNIERGTNDLENALRSHEEVQIGPPITIADAIGTIIALPYGPDVSISDATLVEGDGGQAMMEFTLTLAGPATLYGINQDVRVSYQTVDGTAIGGVDYVATTGEAVWGAVDDPNGPPQFEPSTTIQVPIIGDTLVEGDKTFTLEIAPEASVCIPDENSSATGTILDDDSIQPQPLNLTVEGALDTAPLDLQFTFTHQGMDNTAAAAWYNLQISRDGVLVVDQWLDVATACEGFVCAFSIFDDYPYDFENGAYSWLIRSWKDGDFNSSPLQTFTVNIGTPATPTLNGATAQFAQPVLYFNADLATTWYNLQITDAAEMLVFDGWAQKTAICAEGACAFDTGLAFMPGMYDATLRGWGPQGFGGFGAAYPFSVTENVLPGTLTNLSALDTNLGEPSFTWDGDENAQWYQVWGGTADFSSTAHFQWHSAASLGCLGVGPTTCTLDPGLFLTGGDYVWYVQAWGPAGFNNGDAAFWVEGPGFSVTSTGPVLPTALSVDQTVADAPIFSWMGDAVATWYQVWIGGTQGTAFYNWLPAADVACLGGGTCTLDPMLSLMSGEYDWAVQAWGPGGFNDGDIGAWALSTFSVSIAQ